jgi:lysophospholipase L1-like esterase
MAPAPTAGIRILALGDSYTIGEGVRADERWPIKLAALLRARGITVSEPHIIARTGWTTDELAAAIEAARPAGPFDLVTLLIGVNNQYRGRASEEYRAEFRSLLARAIALAGGRADRVIVLSIPDWSVTPFAAERDRAAVAHEIDLFNAINQQEAMTRSAGYVNVTPSSRTAAERPDLIASDGLHPSGDMYTDWASLVLPVALAALDRGVPPG